MAKNSPLPQPKSKMRIGLAEISDASRTACFVLCTALSYALTGCVLSNSAIASAVIQRENLIALHSGDRIRL
jgi:hypothetical protein